MSLIVKMLQQLFEVKGHFLFLKPCEKITLPKLKGYHTGIDA
jgi:hypothetical protein